MILCPRTGRKPWKCLCPEHVAQRTAVGPDVSPTPNRDVGWAKPRATILSEGRLRIWRTDPDTGQIIMNSAGLPLAGDPGDGRLSGPLDEFEREYPVVVYNTDYLWAARDLANIPVKARAELRTTLNHDRYALREGMTVHAFSSDKIDRRVVELVRSRKKLRELGFSPKAGPQEAFMMMEPHDKRTAELEEWARNGEWDTAVPPAELVFRPETDPHLVARALYYMWHAGLGRLEDETSLYHCAADDSYLIRQYEGASDHLRAVGMNRRTLLGYTVPPDAIPIARPSTRIAVHRALEEITKRKIPFPELRAWLQPTIDRVFCAWGAGVATLNGQAVAELGLQKTDRSPTMESPE